MQSITPMHSSPRCGAKTRSGEPCRAPAMTNGRCRMHGGASTGAPPGNQNAKKHGYYSESSVQHRRKIANVIRVAKDVLKNL